MNRYRYFTLKNGQALTDAVTRQAPTDGIEFTDQLVHLVTHIPCILGSPAQYGSIPQYHIFNTIACPVGRVTGDSGLSAKN